MSRGSEPDITRLLRDLAAELKRLQRELEPEQRRGLPRPGDLSRFTSDVAIPSIILLLETNIRALELLRRTIRLADGRDPRGSSRESAATKARSQAEQLGQTTLAQLDTILGEIQRSIEEQNVDDDVSQLLDEARTLQSRIQDDLASQEQSRDDSTVTEMGVEDASEDPVGVDVEAELENLKENLETDDGSESGDDTDSEEGDETGGDSDGDERS